jgi:hypothetical protein
MVRRERVCNRNIMTVGEVKRGEEIRCGEVPFMRLFLAALALLVCYSARGIAAESSALAFVTEYVRELGVNEKTRAQAERELAEPGDKNATIIRGSTRTIMELRTHISMLGGMAMRKPFDDLPGNIVGFYNYKIDAHNEMIAMASAFISGPKPGVDYGAMAARAPSRIKTTSLGRRLFLGISKKGYKCSDEPF